MLEVKRFVAGELSVNTYVVYGENEGVLVDPAYDLCAASAIKEFNAEKGIELRAILLTHGHFDHCGGCVLFKDLPIFLSRADAEFATRASYYAEAFGGFTAFDVFPDNLFCEETEFIEAGHLRFKIIHTPGHSKGSVCYVKEDIMLSGDTLFKYNVGRTDFPGGSSKEMKNSLNKLAVLGDYKVFPGHGDITTLFFEKKYNPYL